MSLHNQICQPIIEHVKKALLEGVIQRSEMQRHIHMLVKDKYPEVLETNTAYYPSDRALSSLMYQCHLYNRWNQMDTQRVIDMVISTSYNLLYYFHHIVGLSKERPILGDHPKAHIHEIWWIS